MKPIFHFDGLHVNDYRSGRGYLVLTSRQNGYESYLEAVFRNVSYVDSPMSLEGGVMLTPATAAEREDLLQRLPIGRRSREVNYFRLAIGNRFHYIGAEAVSVYEHGGYGFADTSGGYYRKESRSARGHRGYGPAVRLEADGEKRRAEIGSLSVHAPPVFALNGHRKSAHGGVSLRYKHPAILEAFALDFERPGIQPAERVDLPDGHLSLFNAEAAFSFKCAEPLRVLSFHRGHQALIVGTTERAASPCELFLSPVHYWQGPMAFDGAEVATATPEDWPAIRAKTGLDEQAAQTMRFFKIVSQGKAHYVGASNVVATLYEEDFWSRFLETEEERQAFRAQEASLDEERPPVAQFDFES